MNKLIFIGGIHGVGKGTICRMICEQTSLEHITASEILKWSEISHSDNKLVSNIQETQDRLILGLENGLKKDAEYLLDGHFCLFNSTGQVEKVPMETFKKIAPKLIAVVTENVDLIKERLEKRDNTIYSFTLLMEMQRVEIEYAQLVSSTLNVPFVEIKEGDYQALISKL